MERGNRGSRRSRGRPFIRGYYRGRTRGRSILSSRTPDPREKFESYDDNEKSSTHEEKSWSSPSDKRHKTRENSRSPSKENNDNNNERNSPSEKKEYYSDAKYHKHSSDYPFRDQRRPYQNNYWERSTRGRPYSPQSQYRVRPYHSPTRNSRRYSRTPERRRSHSRYRSRSHTSSRYRSHSRSKSRSRRPSPSKHRSPRRRSISRHPKTSDEHNKFSDKNKIIRNTSDNSNDSDDFVEKLEASKNSKTPRRIEYSGNDDDEYWIESGKKHENIPKEPKTPGRSNFSSRAPKTPGRLELSAKDDDNYWENSQSSKSAKKTQYLNTWDDSPIREEPFSKAPKTPGRKEFSSKDSDDYWTKSSPKIKELYSKKNKNQNLSSIYVQDLGSSNSECDNSPKQSRSMSITNSDKSDTPLSLTEKSSKSTNPSSISQTSISKISKNISESLPPTIGSENLLGYGSHWTGISNTSASYLPTDNFSQPQVTQFTGYQHPIVPQNSQWYQPSYQQYGSQYQQFEQKQSIPFNQVHPNLEQVVSYQSSNQGLFNCDLKQVIDISKPPPNVTSITPDVQSKNVQDNMFEMQRETYTTKLMSLKKELEFLQIQYDQFKSDNSNGHYNDELKQNRKAQDDINGKIKGVNNILEVLNTMIPKNSVNDIKKVETRKTIPESEYVSTKEDSIANFERSSILKSQSHSKSSSPSSEYKKRHSIPASLKQEKKTLRSQSSDEDDSNLKKSRQSKETLESKKKKNRNIAKVPQFNFVYCDSCIHWCQTCNIFPKTAKEYLTHLQSESHKTILEELNIVELPWHNTQVEPTQPEKNPELPNKRVPIKGLEFFIGTTAWYCKLCDTWIGDLHCASAHFKSKSHNDLYAALIAKEPNWEIDWLTKRTRAFEKSLLQVNKPKQEFIKEEKLKDSIVIESKPEKSFFEKDFKKEKERDKEKERLRDKEKNKREIARKNTEIKNKLSPIIGENNDSNNVSISDWMKPINLPVEKSLITLKENVQKAKEKLSKHKTDEVEEYKSRTSETQKNKKQKLDEPKASDSTEKKEDNCIMINRSKIKLPFIGKMPFAKPVTKKTSGSQSKEVPNYMVETKCEELKEKPVTSVESQMHIMEHMISAINEKKIEKQTLPIDMDIDDENEYDEMILGAKTNLFQPQLNIDLPRNQVLHNFNLPHTSSLPQDLNAALNMIFPCNEPTIGTCVSVPVNIQNNNLMDPQNICIYPEMNRMLNSSPERKKKKNAPSQRKRRHMKKNMGKDDEYNKNEEEEVDDKLDELISSVSRKDNINKSNGNESEGDELAMLGIDVEDMAAQYY